MIDPDTLPGDDYDHPDWAKGTFGLEIDTDYMEPVVAFTGDIDVDWEDDIDSTWVALYLTDTINKEIVSGLTARSVIVNPKYDRNPCRIVGTNGRMDGRIGPALGPPPRPHGWDLITAIYIPVNIVEQKHENAPQMLTYAGDCSSFDSLAIQWADSTAGGDSLPPRPADTSCGNRTRSTISGLSPTVPSSPATVS